MEMNIHWFSWPNSLINDYKYLILPFNIPGISEAGNFETPMSRIFLDRGRLLGTLKFPGNPINLVTAL